MVLKTKMFEMFHSFVFRGPYISQGHQGLVVSSFFPMFFTIFPTSRQHAELQLVVQGPEEAFAALRLGSAEELPEEAQQQQIAQHFGGDGEGILQLS